MDGFCHAFGPCTCCCCYCLTRLSRNVSKGSTVFASGVLKLLPNTDGCCDCSCGCGAGANKSSNTLLATAALLFLATSFAVLSVFSFCEALSLLVSDLPDLFFSFFYVLLLVAFAVEEEAEKDDDDGACVFLVYYFASERNVGRLTPSR